MCGCVSVGGCGYECGGVCVSVCAGVGVGVWVSVGVRGSVCPVSGSRKETKAG